MTEGVSVVIPAYNNGRVIRETLRSVLMQNDVDDLEVIVADHSSTDDTRSVIEEFSSDPRLTILTTTEAGGGAPRNWNRVTEAATRPHIKLVCGDDVLRPGVLARQSAILGSSDSIAMTASRRDIVDANGAVIYANWGLRGLTSPMTGARAVRKAVRAGSNLFGEPASVMLRRSTLEAVGGWFDAFPYLIDQATYSRVLMEGDFVPDGQTGATFRMSATQWSVALTKDQSSQARAFHRWIHDEYPDAVSSGDVAVGDLRARAISRARHLSYKVLERRMR